MGETNLPEEERLPLHKSDKEEATLRRMAYNGEAITLRACNGTSTLSSTQTRDYRKIRHIWVTTVFLA